MSTHLMLVADHASARLFRVPGRQGDCDEVTRVDNPAGHGHERDLGSSAPGRGTGGGAGRHTAYEAPHSLREHATEVFAQHIVAAVAHALAAEPAARLVIIAGPEMLGVLRRHLPASHGESREWPHSLAKLPDGELHRRLREVAAELHKSAA